MGEYGRELVLTGGDENAAARQFRECEAAETTIESFVESSNGKAEPWAWTKDAQNIIEKVAQSTRR